MAAIADYTRGIQFSPHQGNDKQPSGNALLALNYNGRGNALAAEGKFDLAIADYSAAIEIAPRFADTYANRGLVLLRRGRTSEAERDFEQSLRLDPSLKALLEDRINKVTAAPK